MIVRCFAFTAVLLLVTIPLSFSVASEPTSVDTDKTSLVKDWLDNKPEDRGEYPVDKLNKQESEAIAKLLWNDYETREKKARAEEWKAKVIKLDDVEMKFDFKIFGDKPATGRSLYISMHGGGGTRAAVNEQQWKNQINLYKPEEGVYLAPRSPTDTWNMWHRDHIDKFFQRVIENAILFEGVDSNRVYLLGYSAGGDGVYQLAPRMADSLAAAAMMAGHPNGASPRSLRNIGFTLHMGGKDKAYKRNQIARKWKTKLAELREADPDGYEHEVVIHEEFGHWMKRKDAVAIPWMAKFTRNPNPKKIVWRQSGVTHEDFYWLRQPEGTAKAGSEITVVKKGQNFAVESATGMEKIAFYLNDEVIDLDQPVTIQFGEEKSQHKIDRQFKHLYQSIQTIGDPNRIYSAELETAIPADFAPEKTETKEKAKAK